MSEEVNDEVLSEVHVFTHHEITKDSNGLKRTISRFIYKVPRYLEEAKCISSGNLDRQNEDEKNKTDSDGDLNVERKPKLNISTEAVTLYHSLETKLEDVGLQVWTGCLLLCDYILYNNCVFKDKIILDLGAGVGLTSIIAAQFASLVYCTDYDEGILSIAKENIELNNHLIQNVEEGNNIETRQLNWLDCEITEKINTLSEEEIKKLDIILAAEVIYDIDLTSALFTTLSIILEQNSSLTIFISLEKRLNFTRGDCEITSPAYCHFRECLDILQSKLADKMTIEYSQISSDCPQYFFYSRIKELELWNITSIPKLPNR